MQFAMQTVYLSLVLLATSGNAQNATSIASSLNAAASSALQAASSTPTTILPTLPPTFSNASSAVSSVLSSAAAEASSIQDVTLTEFVPAPTTAGPGAASGTAGAAGANPSLAAAPRVVNGEWALARAGLIVGVWNLL